MIDAGAAIRPRGGRRAAGQLAAVLAVAIAGGHRAPGAGAHLLLSGGVAPRPRADDRPATGRCAVRPRGRPGRGRRRRSRRCATRPGAASRSARCAAARSRSSSSTHTASQECPLAGRALAAAERALPAAQRPVLVVVSVNPQDTPASVRAAVRSWGLAGRGAVALADGQRTRSWRRCGARTTSSSSPTATATSPTPRRCTCSTAAATSARATCSRICRAFVTHDMRTLAGADGRRACLSCRGTAGRGLAADGAALARRRARPATLARLRDADQAADHVAAGADRGVRDGGRRRRRRRRRCRWRRWSSAARSPAAARARSTTCSTATSTG